MKVTILGLLAVSGLWACDACYPNPTTPPPVDDPVVILPDDAAQRDGEPLTTCGLACARLAALGCPEGRLAQCSMACEAAGTSPASGFRAACASAAQSKDAARDCGVRCAP